MALDLPADLALATRNASTGAHAALGRVESVSVVGSAVSVGGAWWWERMPERIATAGLGEWELGRRQATEYDPALAATTDPFAKPHYEQRHWHLHRNGRFDVVGRSPLDPDPDGGAQAARVRQFSPYGRPIGEALVDPATGEATPVGDALTPAEIDAHPASIFSRRRIWERGLTGKPWDPELGLYWFGYRWYSPTLRRWTQQEPLGLDGPNLYHYVFADPVGSIDADGLYRMIGARPLDLPFGTGHIGSHGIAVCVPNDPVHFARRARAGRILRDLDPSPDSTVLGYTLAFHNVGGVLIGVVNQSADMRAVRSYYGSLKTGGTSGFQRYSEDRSTTDDELLDMLRPMLRFNAKAPMYPELFAYDKYDNNCNKGLGSLLDYCGGWAPASEYVPRKWWYRFSPSERDGVAGYSPGWDLRFPSWVWGPVPPLVDPRTIPTQPALT